MPPAPSLLFTSYLVTPMRSPLASVPPNLSSAATTEARASNPLSAPPLDSFLTCAGSGRRIPSRVALAGMLGRLRIRLFGGPGGFGIQPNQRGLIDRALIASVGFIGVPFVLLAALGTYQYHHRCCFSAHVYRSDGL